MKTSPNSFASGVLALTLSAVATMSSPTAWAQTAGTGTITGNVTDTTGASVPDVTVTIINTETGATRTFTTTASGVYSATFLQPGTYEVILGGGAYSKLDQKNIPLKVGQTISIDGALAPASVSTEVTVSEAPPLIETDKVQISQDVDEKLVTNLPVNGRRYDNFVLLTTNVVPDGNSGLISYRGISGLYNTNLIDGANNQQAFFSEARGRGIGAPYVFSQDSIREFQSSTSGYSAEFGQAAGGQINAISRSGANRIHGDLFYYLRYPSLNALDPYSKYTGRTNGNSFLLQPTVHQQQQFGGSVGGPIIKDKLFYFFTYDGFRKVNPLLYTSSITNAALAAYSCPAPITAEQCNNAKSYISGLSGSASRNLKQDIFFPRLDWQFNDRNHVSAEFNWQNYNQPNGYTTSATANNSSSTTNGRADFHERIFIANWESALSNTSANALRFQWARDLEVTGANSPGPSVSISGLQTYGMPNALPRAAFPDEHRWQVADTYSKTLGKHTVKFGVDLNFIHEYISNLFQGGGIYSYSNGNALQNFQDWVQDVYGVNGGRHYYSFTQVNDPFTGKGIDDFWNKDLAGFVEDSWKASSSFTVNYGVRYDTQLVPQPERPYTTSANGVASPLGNQFTSTIHTNYKMFQPRVGFAWSPHPGMVVRGGYGIFYGLSSNSTFYATRVENGVYQQQYSFYHDSKNVYTAGAPQNLGVLFNPPGPALAAPFAGAVTPTVQSATLAAQKVAFRGQDPSFTNPYTHSFDLGVEQQLPGNVSLSISYVGTRGMRLPYFIDGNLPSTNITKTYTVQDSAGTTTQTLSLPFYSNTISRPSPNDAIILTGYSGINTWYHSGAFSIRKPFSHGLELLVNYTWAKALDGGQVSGQNGTFNGTNVILDPHNPKREYSRSDLDMRGRFVGSIVWSPKVSLSNRYARYAVNGWTITGIATEQTGLPLTPMMSNSPSGGIDGGLTGGEVSLYASNTGGRSPVVARNSIPGPGIRNVDARISRDFPIRDGIRFQIFAEVFNLANRMHVISQNTTGYQVVGPTTTNPSTGQSVTASCSEAVSCFIKPYTSTPFGAPTSTSSTLFGPRQLQFTAKLFF